MGYNNERGAYWRPEIGCIAEYTKRVSGPLDGRKWFRCEVIAYDGGEPVIKTDRGYYRRRPVDGFVYRPIDN